MINAFCNAELLGDDAIRQSRVTCDREFYYCDQLTGCPDFCIPFLSQSGNCCCAAPMCTTMMPEHDVCDFVCQSTSFLNWPKTHCAVDLVAFGVPDCKHVSELHIVDRDSEIT